MRDRHAGEFAEIHSVGRALDLLEIMQRAAPAGIRVSDAAATLGVDPATVSRLMSTLITRGYASRMPSRRYTLGCALVAACLRLDRPLASGGGRADEAHRRRLRRNRVPHATGRHGGRHIGSVDRRPTRHDRRRNRAELSSLGDGGGACPPWHTSGCAKPRAAAGRAISGFYHADQDDVARSQCGDASWPPQRHLCRGRRGRLVPELLRHAAPTRWERREAGGGCQLRGRASRERAPAHQASVTTRMAGLRFVIWTVQAIQAANERCVRTDRKSRSEIIPPPKRLPIPSAF